MSPEVFPFGPGVRRLHVALRPGDPPTADEAVERAWQRMKRDNPRLFGGGIYNVLRFSIADGTIEVAHDLYKRLVVQPEIETGVNQLSTSALATGLDAQRQRCVLLGQRGEQTRIYGGMWQICPAGGVDPPDDPARLRDLAHEDIEASLRREFHEEVGFDAAPGPLPPIAIVHDRIARSYDVVLAAEFAHTLEPRPRPGSHWEHLDIRWVPIAQLPRFAREHRLIDPTLALFRSLTWLPA